MIQKRPSMVRLRQGVKDWCPILLLGTGLTVASLQGISLADRGYHLFNQEQLVRITTTAMSPDVNANFLWLGSDLLGACWLGLVGQFSVFWARLGGVVLFTGSAAVLAFGLSRFAPLRSSVRVSAVVYLFLACNDDILIHYCTVPSFLTVCCLAILTWDIGSPGDASARAAGWKTVLFGGLISLTVISKLTMAPLIALPALLALVSRWLGKRSQFGSRRVLLAYIGILLGFFATSVALAELHLLRAWLATAAGLLAGSIGGGGGVVADQQARTLAYLGRYAKDAIVAAGLGALIWAGLIGIRRFEARPHLRWLTERTVLLLVPALFVLARTLLRMSQPLQYRVTLALLGWCMFVAVDVLVDHFARKRLAFSLLVAAVFVVPFHALGSDLGLWKAVYGAPFLMGIVLVQPKLSSGGRKVGMRPAILHRQFSNLIIMALLAYCILRLVDFTYHDGPSRLYMNREPHTAALAMQFTTRQRAEAIDGLIDAIHRWTPAGSAIVAAPNIPLVYLLADRSSLLERPWMHKVDAEHVDLLLAAEASQDRYPSGVALLTWDPYAQLSWPCVGEGHLHEDRAARVDAIRSWLASQGQYCEGFRNIAFELWVPCSGGQAVERGLSPGVPALGDAIADRKFGAR